LAHWITKSFVRHNSAFSYGHTKPGRGRLVATFAGLAAGFGLVFLGYARSWYDELHQFTVEVNQKRMATKARDENVKQLER